MLRFRNYLKNELEKRQERNKHYSLRSFSRVLKVEPSFLSKLLRGKKNFTERSINRFSEELGLTLNQRLEFIQTEKDAKQINNIRNLRESVL